MDRHKILIINHVVRIAGAEQALLRFLDEIDRERFEPALACPEEGPLTEEMKERGMAVYIGYPTPRLLNIKRRSLGANRLAMLAYPWDMLITVIRLVRLIRREGFDLVFTNSAKADIYGSLAGRLARRPVVWRIHDVVDEKAFSRFNIRLLTTCAKYLATKVITPSPAVKEALMMLGVPAEKLSVVYYGIDFDKVCPVRKRDEVRTELGIDASAPVAGFVGRLVEWKGPDYFLRAAAAVAKEIPEARFLVVGDAMFGEQAFEDMLRSLPRELGFEDRVIFTGLREDIPDIMASVDVVVHASVMPDPLPNVIIEAMALGLPVVAADGGGIPVMVEDGVTGLVVPPGDFEGMASAMASLLGDEERAARMGRAGTERARRLFDKDENARILEGELLAALAAGHGRLPAR
jgi:glycosyltransferase involved in cell wall biosynthesis